MPHPSAEQEDASSTLGRSPLFAACPPKAGVGICPYLGSAAPCARGTLERRLSRNGGNASRMDAPGQGLGCRRSPARTSHCPARCDRETASTFAVRNRIGGRFPLRVCHLP